MFNANNLRARLVVSVALFLLCSSVNMVPARSFLDEVKTYSKRQGGHVDDILFCYFAQIECESEIVGSYCLQDYSKDPQFKCNGKKE